MKEDFLAEQLYLERNKRMRERGYDPYELSFDKLTSWQKYYWRAKVRLLKP